MTSGTPNQITLADAERISRDVAERNRFVQDAEHGYSHADVHRILAAVVGRLNAEELRRIMEKERPRCTGVLVHSEFERCPRCDP